MKKITNQGQELKEFARTLAGEEDKEFLKKKIWWKNGDDQLLVHFIFISRWKAFVIRIVIVMYNTSLAAKGALANRLQRRTACKI